MKKKMEPGKMEERAMRKMMNIFAAALVMLAALGCEKNETLPDNNQHNGKITLTAVIGNGGTKTSLGTLDNGQYPVLWSEGDKIAVINGENVFGFTLKAGEVGKTKGIFELTDGPAESFDPQQEIKAFYPDSDVNAVSYDGTKITYNVLQQQTFVAGSFGNGAMLMAAYRAAGSTTALSFDNLFGVLKLQLKGAAGETVTSIAVTSDKVLNGAADVSIGALGNSITLSDTDDENKTVVLDCGDNGKELSTENITEFLITLPPNATSEKHSLNITVNTKLGNAEKPYTLNTEQAISAGMIKKMPVIDLSIAYIENGVYYGDGIALPKSADGAETLIWAPVNCGYDENHKYGLLYQWGRKYGQGYDGETPAVVLMNEQLTSADAGSSYDNKNNFYHGNGDWLNPAIDNLWYNNAQEATTKKTQYDPCPNGWRVPTNTELISLVSGLTDGEQIYYQSAQWTTIEDQNDKYYEMTGFWAYGNTTETSGNKVFLPAAGSLSMFSNPPAQNRGDLAGYSSSSVNGEYIMVLAILSGTYEASSFGSYRAIGRSVRCVKE
ncbi:MAG: hypothetical protein IKB48_07545 [Bacteroidales bacterium]|nr:hypothetical protein [Bacteroidales bacterium]